MSIRTYILVVGVLIAAFAVVFMFLDITVHTVDGTQASCGSAAMPQPTTLITTQAACDDAASTRQEWTFPVLLVGLVITAGAALVRRRPTTAKT